MLLNDTDTGRPLVPSTGNTVEPPTDNVEAIWRPINVAGTVNGAWNAYVPVRVWLGIGLPKPNEITPVSYIWNDEEDKTSGVGSGSGKSNVKLTTYLTCPGVEKAPVVIPLKFMSYDIL
jgi:hypothetical protein